VNVFSETVLQWHALERSEQAKYYEMARKEKELHMQLYPGWSARDNYATRTKKKKMKKDVAAITSNYETKLGLFTYALTHLPASKYFLIHGVTVTSVCIQVVNTAMLEVYCCSSKLLCAYKLVNCVFDHAHAHRPTLALEFSHVNNFTLVFVVHIKCTSKMAAYYDSDNIDALRPTVCLTF